MTPLVIGVALCSLLAVIVLVVVALPHLREGEDLLSDSGRERVREQAQRARGALADVSDAVRARASRPAAVAGGQDQPPTEAAAPLPAAVPVRPTPVPVRPAPVPVRPAPGPVSGDGGASARPVPAPVPVANVPARAAAPPG
ncbi:MAG: hypothetical protein U0Q15_16625 [Kineosporiaceae bacterium]